MNDITPYKPDLFEVYGRKLKIEYLGMASVYAIIAIFFFGGFPSLSRSIIAMLGSFFLFLGLKKKTKDHFSGSLILFSSVAVACGPVIAAGWEIPYFLFGFAVFAMEGYLEKRQYRIYLLPVLFFFRAYTDASRFLGIVFVAIYLTHPWAEKPGLRRRLSLIVIASFIIGIATWIVRYRTTDGYSLCPLHQDLLPMNALSLGFLALMVVLTIICLIVFFRRSVMPHRLNSILFCALSPFDGRLATIFAMTAAVIISATLCWNSIYSDRKRPFFKHAEWYYFWIVFAVAIYICLKRPLLA